MNFCRICGTPYPPDAKFCGACGAPRDAEPDMTPPGGARLNALAVGSLILAVLWILGIGSLLAIVLGAIAHGQIERSRGAQKGRGLATAGIVLGAGTFIVSVIVAVFLIASVGSRMRSQDFEAQTSLRNTVTAAKAIYTDHSDYREANYLALAGSEQRITFLAPAIDSDAPNRVSAGAKNEGEFIAAVRSRSGTCWWIRDVITGYDTEAGTRWNRIQRASSCRAALIPSFGWTAQPRVI